MRGTVLTSTFTWKWPESTMAFHSIAFEIHVAVIYSAST